MAKRRHCEVLPSFYSFDTLKSIKSYIECLSARKLAYEHFCYTVISNVNVVDVKKGAIRKNMTVILHDNQIDSVFPSGEKLPGFPKGYCVKYVSGSGKYLSPGLCDMHTHYQCGLKNRFRFLLSGVTTIRTMDQDYVTVQEKILIGANKIVGPDVYNVSNDISNFTDSALISTNYDARASWQFCNLFGELKGDSIGLAQAVKKSEDLQYTIDVESFNHLPSIFYPASTVFERRTGFRYLQKQNDFNSYWFIFKNLYEDHDMLAEERAEIPAIDEQLVKDDSHFCLQSESGSGESDAAFHSLLKEMIALHDSGFANSMIIRMATCNAGEMVYATTSLGHKSITNAQAPYWELRFGEVKEKYVANLLLLDANPLNDLKNYSGINCLFLNGTCYTSGDLTEMKAALDKW